MKTISLLRGALGLIFTFAFTARAEDAPEFTTTASGLQVAVTHRGDGPAPQPGQVVIAHYTGTLPDGTVFDSSVTRGEPFAFTLGYGQVIKGWDEGFALLRVGDKATLLIPPSLAYGDRERGPIPANSTLRFDVELLDLKAEALADLLREIIDSTGVEVALERFVALKADNFGDYYVSEAQLNALGYRYLGKEQVAAALAVFKLNVELFPTSANTHDSLGEALLASGDKSAALAAYRQSLALDPTNENAAKIIAEQTAAE